MVSDYQTTDYHASAHQITWLSLKRLAEDGLALALVKAMAKTSSDGTSTAGFVPLHLRRFFRFSMLSSFRTLWTRLFPRRNCTASPWYAIRNLVWDLLKVLSFPLRSAFLLFSWLFLSHAA